MFLILMVPNKLKTVATLNLDQVYQISFYNCCNMIRSGLTITTKFRTGPKILKARIANTSIATITR